MRVDLLGVGGADRGGAAGDVGDVDVGTDLARLLGALQQLLAGGVEGGRGNGTEDRRVAADVGEQFLGQRAFGGDEVRRSWCNHAMSASHGGSSSVHLGGSHMASHLLEYTASSRAWRVGKWR